MAYFSEHYHSISGLHVALVAAFFFGATRWILKLFPSILLRLSLSKTSALVAVVPVIFYTFIAGLGVAAVRSTILMLSCLFALLLDREKDLYDALFLAAFQFRMAWEELLAKDGIQQGTVARMEMDTPVSLP